MLGGAGSALSGEPALAVDGTLDFSGAGSSFCAGLYGSAFCDEGFDADTGVDLV